MLDQFDHALISGAIVSYFNDGPAILGRINSLDKEADTATVVGFSAEDGSPAERTVNKYKLYFASETELKTFCHYFCKEPL